MSDTTEATATAELDNLRWLLAGGFTVSVCRYLDSGPPAVLLHEVVLRDDEGEHVLTVDGQPTLGEAFAEARRQATDGPACE